MKTRIILVDDHLMFREALRAPLSNAPDLEIIGETGTGAETFAAFERDAPDVLVIDISLPDMNGIEIVAKLTKQYPNVQIIALSGYAERIYVEEMLKAGAIGYVLKSAGVDELISAIRAATKGNSFLSPEIAQLLVRRIRPDGKTKTPPPSVLGKRETEVLRLLSSGKRSAEIAQELGITVATIEVHRRNIKQKLGLYSTAELTSYAIHEGLAAS